MSGDRIRPAAAADITRITHIVDTGRHPIDDHDYADACARRLSSAGAVVLDGFVRADVVSEIVAQSAPRSGEAYYADSTHNVYLTDREPTLGHDHPFNRQVVSSKGLIADDQVPIESPLRRLYDDPTFRDFLSRTLGVDRIHPYADEVSSINVHFADDGRELGWHFDNSSFAVTLLLQAPERGGVFQYVPDVRDVERGEMGFDLVDAVLDGTASTKTLRFDPGDLVLFRGRNSLHRVTPTEGAVTRILAVLAYNEEPGIGLSESALKTFFGRTGVAGSGSSIRQTGLR